MNVLIDGEIVLHGTVGDDFWGEGFTPRDVLNALVELGRDSDVTVRINSGGGIALDGVAIYNALSSHGGNVTVVVEGIAASAASIIAMGGDTIVMRTGTLMMIHDPSSVTWGTAEDHEKSSAVLDKLGDQLASIYAARTGSDIEEMRDAMKVETWLSPDEALDGGFADRVESEEAATATAFDYRLYEHAPENLVALAASNSWGSKRSKSKPKPTARKSKAAAKSRGKPKAQSRSDTPMPKKETEAPTTNDAADARADERKRIGTIMNSEHAKGRADLASYYAYETEYPADECIEAMKRAPAEAKAETPTPAPVKEEPKPNAEAAAPSILGLELGNEPATATAKVTINTNEIYANRAKKTAA